MKIVVAPDSFKGSLSAAEACEAIAHGVRRALPGAEIVTIPMADGGEGTVDALVLSTGGRHVAARVTGPLDKPVKARYGILGDGKTAVIEMAAASGLPLVPPEKRNPLKTTTCGTGELIRNALEKGCRRFIIGIGGSATTDCGAGMAQALGVAFLRAGRRIEAHMTGGLMGEVDDIDYSGLLASARESEFIVACDVDNPLLGSKGAVAVYSPQKGATPEQCEILEANMTRIIGVIERVTGRSVRDAAGAGAAGGLGAALMAFLGARLRRGVDIVLEQCRFAERIAGASLVITGEGQIDYQTAFGKTPSGVARVAKAQGIPVVALAGSVGKGADRLAEIGIQACLSICPGPLSLAEAMSRGAELLESAAERLIRVIIIELREQQ